MKQKPEKPRRYHCYTSDISPWSYNIHFSQTLDKGCPISIYNVDNRCKHSILMPLFHLTKQAKIQKPDIEITRRSEQELEIYFTSSAKESKILFLIMAIEEVPYLS